MSLLGQIYVVSALVGSAFILFNFVLGQFGDDSSGADGGDGGSQDSSVADDGGAASAHDFSQADDGGAASAHDFSQADDGSSAGHDFNGAPAEARGTMGTFAISVSKSVSSSSRGISGHRDTDLLTRLGFLVLSKLSPMGMAIFLTFFGCAGFFALRIWPALGLLTLIPAVLFAFLISNLFKAAVRWMMKHLESSSLAEVSNLIGQVGEINVPVHKGRTGEVTYIVHSKRFSAPAQTVDANLELERGAKVMIVDTKQHLMLVEPFSE